MAELIWATHPRHLPKPPSGRTVVLDVAFAAGSQWRTKTLPFIDALGPRLVRWIDHHEHKQAWRRFFGDERFVLVPNRTAHACPELVTPQLARTVEPVETVVAHCDFDGALSAVKLLRKGIEAWPGADEDARAIDSPGRGHTLSKEGARIAWAMDEASVCLEAPQVLSFMTRLCRALVAREIDPGLDDELDQLSRRGKQAEDDATHLVSMRGREEAAGVFVVRFDDKLDNRTRRNVLVAAEARGRIGAVLEPDPAGGHWLTAATFDEALDLEAVEGFLGGRSDYRFARAHQGGFDLIDDLSRYAASVAKTAPR